ncbi:FtsX-like permease family protein [Streptomyces hyaluromycini]|uniref:FtsX-like permease family protein n=1 Tax=Streptomyces hyaluromycini TaxID=1377993 RepID=A0ABV1WTN5_9ACTN
MNELLLGLRLLFGSGRGNRARFALMTLGGSIGVCCLAVVLTIPGILAAQDGRVAARQPVPPGRSATAVSGLPLWLERTDPYGSTPLVRIFLARGTEAVAPPPGLKDMPDRGEVFVSPRLHELLRTEPGLAQRLPGREKGLIGPRGLARPEELVAYVGMSRGELSGGLPVTRFGKREAPIPTVDPSTLDILRFTMVGIVLLPLAVFLSVCARLSAAERARRLAALRLLGMSATEVQRVNAAETVAAAGLGALLGLGEYWILNQLFSRLGLPGFTWYPGDGALAGTTLLACLVGCPALAWFAGRAGARRAAADPLAVRRAAVEKPPSSWGFLPLIAGSGIAAGYCAAGFTGHAPRDTFLPSLLVPAAIIMIGVGLVTTLAPLCRILAQRVARSTGSLSLGLAMRRNEAEPSGTLRVAAGLVLLVFAASLAQGVLIQLDQATRNPSRIQSYDIPYEQLTGPQREALQRLPGTLGHVVGMQSSLVGASETAWSPHVVLATCAQLRAVVSSAGRCVDGQAMRLRGIGGTQGEASRAGVRFAVQLEGKHRDLSLTVPQRTLFYREFASSLVIAPESVLVPPSELPRGSRPTSATLTLVSTSAPDVVRRVLDGIGHVAPTADVLPQGLDITGLQQIAVIKTLLAVGMVLGLVIGIGAYLVAATDRAVERRPQVTALALLGARPRTLRAVQAAQVVLPLAVGLLLAVVVGKMAESGYLVTGGGAIFWDGAGLPLLLAGTLGVMVVAVVGALPLVGRRIDPELIRRD